jgi:hypothetical protein
MAKRKSAAKKATRKSTPAKRSAAGRKTAVAAKGSRGKGAAKAARKAARKVVARKAAKKVTAKKAVTKVAAKKASASKKASKAVKRPVSTLAKKTAAPKVAAKAPVKAPLKATAKAPAPVAKAAAPKKAAPKDKPVGTDRASIPSSLVLDQHSSSAQSGRQAQRDQLKSHHETSPEITGGDVDADWETAYSSGDEAPGGDNPTPDQDRVDDIGKALGVEYEDNEELKGADKITDRDKHRWELNPASSDDYRERK